MKIFTKICLAVCLVLLGIGALCVGAGMALGSGFKEVQQMADAGELNIGNWHVGNHEFYYGEGEEVVLMGDFSDTYASEQIENLHVDIKYGEILFTSSSTDSIEVSIQAPKRNSYTCKIDGGTLKIKDETSRPRWRVGDKGVTVEISIPEGKEFEDVKIKTDAGTVEAEYKFQARNIDLELGAGELVAAAFLAEESFKAEVGAGNLEIAEFSAEKLKVDCGVGNAELKGTVAEKVDADCGVGNLTLILAGSESDYNYEIDCGIGEVQINNDFYSGLSEQKNIDNDADKDIQLDCGVGKLKVKNAEWEETVNGTEKTI